MPVISIQNEASCQKSGEIQPKRPVSFTPFHYKNNIEKLYENFSDDMMKRAAKADSELDVVNEKGKYKPIVYYIFQIDCF